MRLRRIGLAALLAVLSCVPAFAAEPAALRGQVRAWRTAHEKEVVRELADLVALRNVAANRADIERNADHLIAMFKQRGIEMRRLNAGEAPPAIYGNGARVLPRQDQLPPWDLTLSPGRHHR